jgi:hypothetical protein
MSLTSLTLGLAPRCVSLGFGLGPGRLQASKARSWFLDEEADEGIVLAVDVFHNDA